MKSHKNTIEQNGTMQSDLTDLHALLQSTAEHTKGTLPKADHIFAYKTAKFKG